MGGAGTRGEPRAETQRTARDIGAKASAAEQHASLCVLAADTSSRRQSLRVVPRAVGSSPPSRHGAPPAVPCAAHRQGAWRLRVSLAPTAHAMPSALSNPKPRRTPGRALCVFVRGVRRRFCPPRLFVCLFVCYRGRLVWFVFWPPAHRCDDHAVHRPVSACAAVRSASNRRRRCAFRRIARTPGRSSIRAPLLSLGAGRSSTMGVRPKIRFLLIHTNEICRSTAPDVRVQPHSTAPRRARSGCSRSSAPHAHTCLASPTRHRSSAGAATYAARPAHPMDSCACTHRERIAGIAPSGPMQM